MTCVVHTLIWLSCFVDQLSGKQEASTEKSAAASAGSAGESAEAAAAAAEEQAESEALSNDRMLELIRVLRQDKELYETK